MERHSFYFLYVNVNSLAELALQQLAAKIISETPEADPIENLSDEERDARVLASFANMDLSALDGVGVSSDAEMPESLFEEHPAPSIGDSLAGSDEELDVERYLARAYSYEVQLRERIDDCYRRADLAEMDAALLQLPQHLPPLTSQLSATQMEEWLALYAQDNEVLGNLTIQIRRLDMGSN